MERQQEYELRKKIADAIQNDVDRVFSEKLQLFNHDFYYEILFPLIVLEMNYKMKSEESLAAGLGDSNEYLILVNPLREAISIRGAEVFDSTHRAEGDLEGLLAIADIVIDIDGKEKEEVLKELLMKLSDATALSDDNLPLCQIREFIDLFNKDRKWKSYHNAKDLIVSINIEASELLEIFQWTNKKTEPSPEMMERIKEELADVLIYSIDLANA